MPTTKEIEEMKSEFIAKKRDIEFVSNYQATGQVEWENIADWWLAKFSSFSTSLVEEIGKLDKPNVGYGQGKIWLDGKERETISHNFQERELLIDEVQEKIKKKLLALLTS